MDSELRRFVLTATALFFASLACICFAVPYRDGGLLQPMFAIPVTLAAILAIAFVSVALRCVRIRSMVGKAEVSFVCMSRGEYTKEPPISGKRPKHRSSFRDDTSRIAGGCGPELLASTKIF
ncbi:MAG: hypothetical protein ACI4Q9_00285 [Candidatus Methanomethylophilaceae archaeon]